MNSFAFTVGIFFISTLAAISSASEITGSVSELNALPTQVRIAVAANQFRNLGHPDADTIAKDMLKEVGLRICSDIGGNRIAIKGVEVKAFRRDGVYAAASGLLNCFSKDGQSLGISEQSVEKYQNGDEQSLAYEWSRYKGL